MSVFDWLTTASSNGNADATINFQENQAPSTVNDSARALMARVAYWVKMFSGNNTQGGSSNAYTITTGESLSAYAANMRFLWTPNADSTGASTLNVDAIGAKKVYLPTGVQAGSGDIESNSVYDVVYQTALDSAAGGFKIVGTGGSGDLKAANNLSDLASASTSRTNLGLGTSATVDTGTSGATIPLLNGTNTWSATQTIENTQPFLKFSETGVTADNGLWRFNANGEAFYLQTVNDAQSSAGNALAIQRTGTTVDSIALTATAVTINAGTAWHSANDGAGSGLDADTVDGVEASAFAILSGSNIYLGQQQITSASPAFVLYESDAGTNEKYWRLSSAAGALRIQANNDAVSSFVNAVSLQRSGDTITEIELNATLIDINANADISGDLTAGSITAPPAAGTTTTGTLVAADANCDLRQLTGNITIPASVFATGTIMIGNSSGVTRTITRGAGLTMYVNGTNVASCTVAIQGVFAIRFSGTTICTVRGDVS